MCSRSTTGAAPRLAVAVAAILALLAHSTSRATELDKRQLELLDKADRSKMAPDLIETIPRAIFEARFKAGQIAMGNEFSRSRRPPHRRPSSSRESPEACTPSPCWTWTRLARGPPSSGPSSTGSSSTWRPETSRRPSIQEGERTVQVPPPQASDGIGSARYVFVAYKQYRTIESPQTLVVPHDKRKNFNIGKFAKEKHLGSPIAINYFLAEHGYVDGYTPMASWVAVVAVALIAFVSRVLLMYTEGKCPRTLRRRRFIGKIACNIDVLYANYV
ncbi:hypothetical protein HPB49_017304 [Dermacentor silvarum]|uniref:Uncharacterized protein n=1 Tax=Dermacentor silvarum TaxID=543639 RepID=A0ACB8D6X2_DERSI|nr:hypothetical protein HPB49_017304 [Dermacentor silvarum]